MTYQDHPIAAGMPAMSKAEYLELKASIEKNGLRDEVVLLDKKVLDGRHRYRACLETGVEPRFRDWNEETDGSPWLFVWDKNAERRHLEKGVKACLWLTFEAG